MIIPKEVLEAGRCSKDNITRNIISVMREFGYTIQEINEMPIPTFMCILEKLQEDHREMERRSKSFKR